MPQHQNSGFTLIELTMVIILLGILSITVLPRFIHLSNEAEQAVFDSYYGALKSSVKMYHLSWMSKGNPSGNFGNFSSVPSLTGYPAGGAVLNTAFESDCTTIWGDLLQGADISLGFISATNGWSASISKEDWMRSASQIASLGESEDLYCHFVYTSSYFSGGFSGSVSERIPTIQYNIKTGVLAKVSWPYNP